MWARQRSIRSFTILVFKYTLTIKDYWFNINITQEHIRFVIMIEWSAFNSISVSIFHYFDGIFNKIEPDMRHNSGISHMAYIYFCDFHIAISILLQIE